MNKVEVLVQQKIVEVRGRKVMFDFELARLYGVPTKVLTQSVKRNLERFPDDFMFQLTEDEFIKLRSHIVTSKRRSKIFSLCIYRARSSHVIFYFEFFCFNSNQYCNYASVCFIKAK